MHGRHVSLPPLVVEGSQDPLIFPTVDPLTEGLAKNGSCPSAIEQTDDDANVPFFQLQQIDTCFVRYGLCVRDLDPSDVQVSEQLTVRQTIPARVLIDRPDASPVELANERQSRGIEGTFTGNHAEEVGVAFACVHRMSVCVR